MSVVLDCWNVYNVAFLDIDVCLCTVLRYDSSLGFTHELLLTHRLQCWTGQYFKDDNLRSFGIMGATQLHGDDLHQPPASC